MKSIFAVLSLVLLSGTSHAQEWKTYDGGIKSTGAVISTADAHGDGQDVTIDGG